MQKQRTAKYGSYVRRSDGAKIYVTTVELPADPGSGKRKQTRLTATSQRELDAMVTALRSEINDGRLITNEMQHWPMRQYLTWWLDERRSKLAEATYDRYADEIARDIVPVVGNVAVGKLTEMHIEQVQKRCLKRGLSPATANLVHNILHRAMKDAKRLRIARENVVDYVDPLKQTVPKTIWWTVEQMAQFLSVAVHHPLEPLWRLALLAGLRRGELLGLRWADIDLDNRVLRLERSYSRRGGRYVDGPTKSESSMEPILLSESVVTSLRAHKAKQLDTHNLAGTLHNESDLVFTDAKGFHIHPNTLRYQFKRLIAQAGVPDIRIHDMRHSNGSAMGSTPGANLRVVQARLRHASLRTTERYLHTDLSGQEGIVHGLEDRITGYDTAP